MLSFDPTSSWEEQQEMVRKTFIRTGDTVPDEQLLGEDLSDVVIEVHPEVEAGVTPGTANIAAARIPAHSAILANRSKSFHTLFTNVMAQRYPVPIARHLIGHLYHRQDDGIQSRPVTAWEQILHIADEFGVLSLFDNVSIILVTCLYAGHVKDVVSLLQTAYKFSKETSEILRKGCISYCTGNCQRLFKESEFKNFLGDHGCRDLLYEIAMLH